MANMILKDVFRKFHTKSSDQKSLTGGKVGNNKRSSKEVWAKKDNLDDTPIKVAQANQLFPLTFHIFLIRKFDPLLLDQATDREFVVDKSSLAMHTFICALDEYY